MIAEQGVTLVTRGVDLLAATHAQRVLQTLLGLPAPRYAHHRLILDEAGRKLSKRDASSDARQLAPAKAPRRARFAWLLPFRDRRGRPDPARTINPWREFAACGVVATLLHVTKGGNLKYRT